MFYKKILFLIPYFFFVSTFNSEIYVKLKKFLSFRCSFCCKRNRMIGSSGNNQVIDFNVYRKINSSKQNKRMRDAKEKFLHVFPVILDIFGSKNNKILKIQKNNAEIWFLRKLILFDYTFKGRTSNAGMDFFGPLRRFFQVEGSQDTVGIIEKVDFNASILPLFIQSNVLSTVFIQIPVLWLKKDCEILIKKIKEFFDNGGERLSVKIILFRAHVNFEISNVYRNLLPDIRGSFYKNNFSLSKKSEKDLKNIIFFVQDNKKVRFSIEEETGVLKKIINKFIEKSEWYEVNQKGFCFFLLMKWNNDYIVEKNDCFVEKYNYFPFGIVSNYSKVVYQENDYCSNVYPGQEEDDMFGYYNVTDFESILSQIDKHGYANLYFDESCFTHSSFPREVYYLIDSISDFLIHRDSRLAHKGIKIFMVPCNKLSLDDQNRILQMIKNYFDNKKSKKQFAEEQFDEDDEIKT